MEAQGVQELGPLQLGSQGRHVQPQACVGWHRGPRDRPLHPLRPHSREEAVDKVQLGPSEQVCERVLPGKQRSAGLKGGIGQRSSRRQWWETLPMHPPQRVWAGEGVILRALKARVHVRNNSFSQRGEPKVQVTDAEWDPSS